MIDKIKDMTIHYLEKKDRNIHDINKFASDIDKLYRGSLISIVKRVENKDIMIERMMKASTPVESHPHYERIWKALVGYILEGK